MRDLLDLFGKRKSDIIGDMITPKQRQAIKKDPFGNWDGDRVINGLDCQPFNPDAHGKRLRFKRKNLLKGVIPNKAGLYKFYSKKGELLYIGVAKKLRHRVQSYHQKDKFSEHPTKKALRPEIYKYEFKKLPLAKARKIEHKLKHNTKHNHL